MSAKDAFFDSIKNCPFCDSDFISIEVSRFDGRISCDDCGASISYDHNRCTDPPIGDCIKLLIEKWNTRANEVKKNE